jgi:outer membrane immunogenic protein
MKRQISAVAVAALLGCGRYVSAGPEQIETRDSKAMPQMAAVEKECRWTGFYIGGHLGYVNAGNRSFLEVDEGDPSFDFDQDGFTGGGQAGFNLQLGRMFVIGVEGTFAGVDLGADTKIENGETTTGHLDTDWLATVTGRVGLSFCRNHLLVYAKGGVGFTDWDFDTHELGADERFRVDDDEIAALAGVGVEYAFNCHWSVRAEYNHLFFDDTNAITGIETEGSRREARNWVTDKDDWDLFTAGLNFKF